MKKLLSLTILYLFFASLACSKPMGVTYSSAPDFPADAEWLNTDKSYSLKDFQGKVVLIDFWTYCCINCIHIIPDLKKLEAKYGNELVVIGVHSAKFLTERGSDNIRQAILRYEIEHPVINDKDFKIWESYGAQAWPTTVLINPDGEIITANSGEGVFEQYDALIQETINEYSAKGKLNKSKLNFALEKNKKPASLLSFPGKVTADAKSNKLYISDSNNNRILVIQLAEDGINGNIVDIIGSGTKGKSDGDYKTAQFNKLQGTALSSDGNYLYAADTENHLIRKIDLKNKTVFTIAGTGVQEFDRNASGNALQIALNSPWDLLELNGYLYIAMAGNHQLWKMNLSNNEIISFAGSGRENITDGPLLLSALAQPSGITTDGNLLYFADSEVSAIRTADLNENGKVSTIVGDGLFVFGDKDGKGKSALLQHPLGVVYCNGLLYVTDTYNNKIKSIDPVSRQVSTFVGTGLAGKRDYSTASQFDEPGGITVLKDKLYVADTNNELIRVIDINTKEVSTLIINNPLMLSEEKTPFENYVTLPKDSLQENTELLVNFRLPEGYKINPMAYPQVLITDGDNILFEKEIETNEPDISIPLKLSSSISELQIEILLYYCEKENEGICKFKDIKWLLPVNITSNGKDKLNMSETLN